MVTEKIKTIEDYKVKIAALEKEVAKQLHAELAGLPAKYGFASVNGFVLAVKKAAGGRSPSAPSRAAGGKKRRRRARITPEMRLEIKQAVQAGKTGSQIAKEFKISLPSVQNIKKEFGLVKSRKK